MTDMVKKYVPYAVIILLVYMLLPLVFIPGAMQKFSPVAYDFVFPITAIGCSAHYCSKHGLDFLFALIAPIIYLPSMLIYNGGFSSGTLSTNLILLVVYLVAGIFGLFLGDLAFGDKRRQKEKAEQEEAEEMLLEAKRREKEELENMTSSDVCSSDLDFIKQKVRKKSTLQTGTQACTQTVACTAENRNSR